MYEDTCLTCSQKLYIENHFKEHVMGCTFLHLFSDIGHKGRGASG